MAFMNFKNSFLRAKIENCSEKRGVKYSNYELSLDKEKLTYISLKPKLLNLGDELALFRKENKIVLFRNLSKNINNFKEARIKSSLLLFISLCAFLCFLFLFFYNNFLEIDLFFLYIFSLFLVLFIINHIVLLKQIKRLERL